MLRLLLLCMLSFGYTNQINNVSGNIEQFSLMNGNSFIHNIVNDIDTNLYSISFIQYPGHISSGQLLYLEKYKQYFIQSKISTINYGLLRDNDDEFSASDYMIQIAVIKQHSNNFMVGSSVGYAKSHIAHYTSSQLIQDIGFSYSYFNELVIIGFSIENMTHIINEYSNITSQYTHYNNLSCQFNPQHINASLFINYISSSTNYSELVMALRGSINNQFHIFAGKSLYFSNDSMNDIYRFYDNVSLGIGVKIPKYKFNFGLQYLGDIGVVLGSSLSVYTK